MKKKKYIIVDDDKAFTFILKSKLDEIETLEYDGTYHDSITSLVKLQKDPPDILFLDYNIDNFDGFELLNSLDKRPVTIVISSEREIGKNDFPIEVCGFLWKPLRKQEKLESLVEKAIVLSNYSKK